jgi:hypothetical protein
MHPETYIQMVDQDRERAMTLRALQRALLEHLATERSQIAALVVCFKGFPGGAVSKSLANLLRPRDALLYAMTGRRFDGKTAAGIGAGGHYFFVPFFPSAHLTHLAFQPT